MKKSLVSTLLLALASASISACDTGSILEPPPPRICVESGTQCKLESGPLGVCERIRCADDTPGPCFTCTPQH